LISKVLDFGNYKVENNKNERIEDVICFARKKYLFLWVLANLLRRFQIRIEIDFQSFGLWKL